MASGGAERLTSASTATGAARMRLPHCTGTTFRLACSAARASPAPGTLDARPRRGSAPGGHRASRFVKLSSKARSPRVFAMKVRFALASTSSAVGSLILFPSGHGIEFQAGCKLDAAET